MNLLVVCLAASAAAAAARSASPLPGASRWVVHALDTAALVEAALALRGGGGGSSPNVVDAASMEELEATSAGKPRVVKFSAPWCGPCKAIQPLFEELAAEHAAVMAFVHVDTDENPDASAEYGVSALPTFVFFGADGTETGRHSGGSPEKLKEAVEEMVQEATFWDRVDAEAEADAPPDV